MDWLIRDVRYALRTLARRPGFTIAALLTLAVAIGANATIFSTVNAVLLRPLSFGERSDRVVSLHSTHRLQPKDWEDSRLSYADLRDVRAASRLLEDVAGYGARSFTIHGGGDPEWVRGGSVTPNLFPLIDAHPALGRHFREEEAAAPGFEPTVMLSHGLWQRRFAGDPAVVGRTIRVNDRELTVIGVMPRGFAFPERDQLWVAYGDDDAPRDRRSITAIAALREGVSLDQLQSELGVLATALATRHPDTNREWGLRALPYRDLAVDQMARVSLGAMMAAVVFVLLIGCANLANLLLARGVARQREIAVRTAVGASRARIVRQMLIESVLLAAAGAALGTLLARLALDSIVRSWPEPLPYWIRFDLDLPVLAFVAGITVLSALGFGLVPALRYSRPDVMEALTEGARSVGTPGDRRLQSALIAGQVALSLALLVGAHAMIRSFLALQSADAGFDDARMVSLRLNMAGDLFDPLPAKTAYLRRAVERIEAVPGVAAATATSSIPADDGGAPVRVVAESGVIAAGEETPALRVTMLPSLFATLDVPLVQGRTFTPAESEDPAAPVALVNRALARRFWPEGQALSRRLGIVGAGGTTWLTVVGVAPDLQYEEFGEETLQSRHIVYVPYAHAPWRGMALLVRTHARAEDLVQPVRRALLAVAPGVPVYDVYTMAARRRFTTWEQRFFGETMGLFAGVALFLACLGVHGVLSYAVSRRTREIGVRMALGATATDVMRLVLGQAGRLAAAGTVAGILLAVALSRSLESILYGVTAGDPWTMLATAAVLVAVLLAAATLPARRATRIAPTEALRYD